ncbi:MAG: ParB N-terminal domain-containing protein [Deltaproteobacteria bacterium]
MDQLSKSIDQFGLLHPIVITSPDKKGYHSIIAGRRRF